MKNLALIASLRTRSIFFLLVFVFLRVSRVEGVSFTVKGKFLLGYELRESFKTDWTSCLVSCQNDNECVSYNYNTKKQTCQHNSHGVENRCMADQVLHSGPLPQIFHQLKPVTNGRLATRSIPHQCSCNCGIENQCTSKLRTSGLGDAPEQPAGSCHEILQKRRDATNGPYYIKTFPSQNPYIYCHMTELPECGGGGWTLVIKMDGNKQTFSYNSTLWGNMKAYEPMNGANLMKTETLLPTYWSTKFTRLCLGMTYGDDTNWIAVNYTADTLFSVLSSGAKVETNLSNEWQSLLRNSSLQTGCTVQGFNIVHSVPDTASARIGITGFPGQCNATTSSSRIGFGTGGAFYGMDSSNTCGNEAWGLNTDNGQASIKAFGYIFIQ